jgi:hypothetical protein
MGPEIERFPGPFLLALLNPMEVKLRLLGIGDLTLTAMDLLQSTEDNICIFPCDGTIETYRPGNKTYSDFVVSYLQRLLPTKTITKSINNKAPVRDSDIQRFNHNLQKAATVEAFKQVFKSCELPELSECIVLNTKVRQYPVAIFNKHSVRFWDLLNASGRKVVLLGERRVEYGVEYKGHGRENIYSIYPEAIKHLKPANVIDLTVPVLGVETPSVESIFRDMNIISNCYRVINIGGGGFFCTSMVTGKLLSIHNSLVCEGLSGQVGDQLFGDWQEFLKQLESFTLSPESLV